MNIMPEFSVSDQVKIIVTYSTVCNFVVMTFFFQYNEFSSMQD